MQKEVLVTFDELELGLDSQVSDEVRNYLCQTFTGRSYGEDNKNSQFAPASRGKIHNRLFKSSTNKDEKVPDNLSEHFAAIDKWGWSAVVCSNLAGGRPLRWTMYHLYDKYNFFSTFQIQKPVFFKFVDLLEQGYQKHFNTYHNGTHATDVTQTVHHIINQTGLYNWFSDLELMAALFAAAVHDVEHTGTTNSFHVSTHTELATLYNDQSVLENHHIATAFLILRNPNANILANLTREEFQQFRFLVIEMVLSTDMAAHFSQLTDIRNCVEKTSDTFWHDVLNDKADYPKQMEKSKILSLVVHSADISNAVKPWQLHHYFTMQLLQEFFKQGDQEKVMKNMNVSPLCDRQTTKVPNSQISFSKYIVQPTFELLSRAVRLLGDTFLPVSVQQLVRENTMDASEQVSEKYPSSKSGRGQTTIASLGVANITHFKRQSLRPNILQTYNKTSVASSLEEFNQCWMSCMMENRVKWVAEEEKEAAALEMKQRQGMPARLK